MPTMSSSCAHSWLFDVQPFSGVRIDAYFSERRVTTCMRVGLSQTKKGLFASFALSMNSNALSRMTSSTVSMLYLMFGVGWGGSGPSSVVVEERLFTHRRDLLTRLDLVFMDTTSLSRAPAARRWPARL